MAKSGRFKQPLLLGYPPNRDSGLGLSSFAWGPGAHNITIPHSILCAPNFPYHPSGIRVSLF